MSEPHVVLLGPPGAGKGTQCHRIAAAFEIDHIETGALLREKKDLETAHGTPRDYMSTGELVPDEVVNAIVENVLAAVDGFVLDGFPRTVPQAEFLDTVTVLDVVLTLQVSEDTVVQRIAGRRVCDQCGATYHVDSDPPTTETICDECGSTLTQREDDTPAAIQTRVREYQEKTAPVIEFYRHRGIVTDIDGEQSPTDVWNEIQRSIEAVER